MIYVLFYTSASKFGLFLGTDLCQSQEFWYNDKSDEYSGSKDCQIGMGAYMSISSIVAYFISMVLAVGYASRPKAGAYNYEDEDSLPSWMASEAEGISATQKAVAQEAGSESALGRRRSSGVDHDWSTLESQNISESYPPQSTRRDLGASHVSGGPRQINPLGESYVSHGSRISKVSQQSRMNLMGASYAGSEQLVPSKMSQQSRRNLGASYGSSYSNPVDTSHTSRMSMQSRRSLGSSLPQQQHPKLDTSHTTRMSQQSRRNLGSSNGSGAHQQQQYSNSRQYNNPLGNSYVSATSNGSNRSGNRQQSREFSSSNESGQLIHPHQQSRTNNNLQSSYVSGPEYLDQEYDNNEEYDEEYDDDGVGEMPEFQGYNNPPPQDDEISEMTWDMAY